MDDRYVAKRVIYLLGMSAATILFTTAAAFIRGQYLDEWIVLVIINLVFLALWFFLLEHCRMKRSIAEIVRQATGVFLQGIWRRLA